MADISKKRTENIDGAFYVDNTCIDCDTCRWMATNIFERKNNQSAVYKQPENSEDQLHALQALISCPTASIGYTESQNTNNPKYTLEEALKSFPILVEDNVYHCGYHSKKSYGAASYFIKREDGNILIDSPRFTKSLVDKLDEMGGIKYMFLTHKDDVADHQKFHEYFGCKRIIHLDEICESIPKAEIIIDVHHPARLDENSEDRLIIIPSPGHTKGHMLLLYNKKFLFTGDHLSYSKQLNRLKASKEYCWYSWDKQIESMGKLVDYDYEWVLPGHGRRIKANKFALKEHIELCVEWMLSLKG